MIADTIKKTDDFLASRGLSDDSYFEIEFEDGSSVREHEVNWSDISEQVRVEYFGNKKTVMLCTFPVKKITLNHGELQESVEIPEGCRGYQAVRGVTAVQTNGSGSSEVAGRIVGIVKDGVVIEERFLNGLEGRVFGTKL